MSKERGAGVVLSMSTRFPLGPCMHASRRKKNTHAAYAEHTTKNTGKYQKGEAQAKGMSIGMAVAPMPCQSEKSRATPSHILALALFHITHSSSFLFSLLLMLFLF